MSFIDLTRPPTFRDQVWQVIYRLGFPIARAWWWLWPREHVGALIAIYIGHKLLLVRQSYRSEWTFPGGGVRSGETPAQAAHRELFEEIGWAASVVGPAHVVNGFWDGRLDHVHIFPMRLDRPPTLQFDNREIIAARLVNPVELDGIPLTGPVKAYLRDPGISAPGCNG